MGTARPANVAAAELAPEREDQLPSSTQPPLLRALLRRAGTLAAALALGACATAHAKGDASMATVQLTNDLTPPSDVTVYAVTANDRQLLGDVPPGAQTAMQLPLSGPSQRVRLIAQLPSGRAVSSHSFVVTGNTTTINWDLRSNSVWFPKERP